MQPRNALFHTILALNLIEEELQSISRPIANPKETGACISTKVRLLDLQATLAGTITQYQIKQMQILNDLKLNVDDTELGEDFHSLLAELATLIKSDKTTLLNYIKAEAQGLSITISDEDRKKFSLIDKNEKDCLTRKYRELHKPENTKDVSAVNVEQKAGLQKVTEFHGRFFADLMQLDNKIKRFIRYENLIQCKQIISSAVKGLNRLTSMLNQAIIMINNEKYDVKIEPAKLVAELCEARSKIEKYKNNLNPHKISIRMLGRQLEYIKDLEEKLNDDLNELLNLWNLDTRQLSCPDNKISPITIFIHQHYYKCTQCIYGDDAGELLEELNDNLPLKQKNQYNQ